MKDLEEKKRYWRSLAELAQEPDFEARIHEEFPRLASVFEPGTDRRHFLQLMGASLALAGLGGCSRPPNETIMPYVRTPAEITPGIPLHFATAMPSSQGALGLVVTSHMGRPTKVEGNPLHAASLGATDAFAQASVLTLYDPDRSQTVKQAGQISTWDALLAALQGYLGSDPQGAGVRILSSPQTSPTLERQMQLLAAKMPGVHWHFYDAANASHAQLATTATFGEPVSAVYHFDKADVVVSLGSDFLCSGRAAVRYARDFMSRRGTRTSDTASRLYCVESMYSPTGAAADHRLPLRPSEIATFARALAGRWGAVDAPPQSPYEKLINAITVDLNARRGNSIVIAGADQPASVHALAWSINQALGNIGSTISLINSIVLAEGAVSHSLASLVQDLNSGQINLLLILDCNPVYDAPTNLRFAEALAKTTSVHWGLYDEETASRCTWHVPSAHYLESWSDARAYDGTASIVQPLIAPLYEGKTVHEILSALIDPSPQRSYDLVRETWRAALGNDFEAAWHKALADGVIPNSVSRPKAVSYRADAVQSLVSSATESPGTTARPPSSAELQSNTFELVLLPDPTVDDGRLANNGWLQELPKPMTKLTWENAVLLSPADAQRLGVGDGDLVQLTNRDVSVSGPACIVPGHASGCVTCHFGYGRTHAGGIGTGLGFNAYCLNAPAPDGRVTVTVAKTGGYRELARTQSHFAIEGRDIVRSVAVDELHDQPAQEHGHSAEHGHPSFYPEFAYEGFAWGMAIDLSKCMGCNACVVACQAENNIPVVGREQVIKNREMHWLRLDLYYEGEPDNPEAIHQPMLCQHCEMAPCEVVCPVAATTHSKEGLNEMTYNRCIGTRYCSNNCPYKVRRFNFLQYQDDSTPVLKLLRNPNVTVRSRGVMEKCTYCVQRINAARIEAKKQQVDSNTPLQIADGSLQTACQQACPTQAIVFGDINDPQSRVAQLKKDSRNYSVLGELNTQPRTTYLARVRNPNPALAEA